MTAAYGLEPASSLFVGRSAMRARTKNLPQLYNCRIVAEKRRSQTRSCNARKSGQANSQTRSTIGGHVAVAGQHHRRALHGPHRFRLADRRYRAQPAWGSRRPCTCSLPSPTPAARALARVPSNRHDHISACSTTGAHGIVVPMVNSREEAAGGSFCGQILRPSARSVGGGVHALNFQATATDYYARQRRDSHRAAMRTHRRVAMPTRFLCPRHRRHLCRTQRPCRQHAARKESRPAPRRLRTLMKEILAACRETRWLPACIASPARKSCKRSRKGGSFSPSTASSR